MAAAFHLACLGVLQSGRSHSEAPESVGRVGQQAGAAPVCPEQGWQNTHFPSSGNRRRWVRLSPRCRLSSAGGTRSRPPGLVPGKVLREGWLQLFPHLCIYFSPAASALGEAVGGGCGAEQGLEVAGLGCRHRWAPGGFCRCRLWGLRGSPAAAPQLQGRLWGGRHHPRRPVPSTPPPCSPLWGPRRSPAPGLSAGCRCSPVGSYSSTCPERRPKRSAPGEERVLPDPRAASRPARRDLLQHPDVAGEGQVFLRQLPQRLLLSAEERHPHGRAGTGGCPRPSRPTCSPISGAGSAGAAPGRAVSPRGGRGRVAAGREGRASGSA